MSDYVSDILKLYLRMREAAVRFTDTQQEEPVTPHDLIAGYYDSVRGGLENTPEDYLPEILQESSNVASQIRDLRCCHWNRLSQETVAPLISILYFGIASAYRKVKVAS